MSQNDDTEEEFDFLWSQLEAAIDEIFDSYQQRDDSLDLLAPPPSPVLTALVAASTTHVAIGAAVSHRQKPHASASSDVDETAAAPSPPTMEAYLSDDEGHQRAVLTVQQQARRAPPSTSLPPPARGALPSRGQQIAPPPRGVPPPPPVRLDSHQSDDCKWATPFNDLPFQPSSRCSANLDTLALAARSVGKTFGPDALINIGPNILHSIPGPLISCGQIYFTRSYREAHLIYCIVEPTVNNYHFFIKNDSYFNTSLRSSFVYRLKTLAHVHTSDIFEVRSLEALINFENFDDERAITSIILLEIGLMQIRGRIFSKRRRMMEI